MLSDYEVPVAKSVMNWINRFNSTISDEDIFIKYIMLWIAFNNIYVTLASHSGKQRQPVFNDNIPVPITIDSVEFTVMTRVYEKEQINEAYKQFSDYMKDELIKHESTKFFVNRLPKWNGIEFEYDKKGQRVNGVINLSYSYSEEFIRWSPINIKNYNSYMEGDETPKSRDYLSKQILSLLYTVRNNTFHGGKRFDDANDRNVVEKATPLLEIVVNYFY